MVNTAEVRECVAGSYGCADDEDFFRITTVGDAGEACGVGSEGKFFEEGRERFPKAANDEGEMVAFSVGNRKMRRLEGGNISQSWVDTGLRSGGREERGLGEELDRRPTIEGVGLGLDTCNGPKEASMDNLENSDVVGLKVVGSNPTDGGDFRAENCDRLGDKEGIWSQAFGEAVAAGSLVPVCNYSCSGNRNGEFPVKGLDLAQGEQMEELTGSGSRLYMVEREGPRESEGGGDLEDVDVGESRKGGNAIAIKRKRGRPRKTRRGGASKSGVDDVGRRQEMGGVESATLQFDTQSVRETEAKRTLEVAELLGLRSVVPKEEALKRVVKLIREEDGDS